MGFRSSILAGDVLIREAIQSPDYVPGVSGWSINRDGSAEFNDIAVRGEVTAGSGADYVKVTPDPNPHIEFSTSNVNQDAPASIGFDSAGGNSFTVSGPDLGRGSDSLTFAADPVANETRLQFSDVLELSNPGLEVRLRMVNSTQSATWTANGFFNVATPSFRTNGIDRGKGIRDYTAVTASTALATTEAIGITSDTVTFELNRAYRVTYHYQGSGNTAADEIGFRLRRTNVTGNSLFDSLRTHQINAAGAIVNGETAQIVVNNTGAALDTVIVGTVYRAAGAGSVQFFANATNPGWISIEDIGASSDYPGARSL